MLSLGVGVSLELGEDGVLRNTMQKFTMQKLSKEVKKQQKETSMCVQYQEGPVCTFKSCKFKHEGLLI